MIYISSSCVKSSNIKESIEILQKIGFSNIELSGGTKHYAGLEEDLLELKVKHGLNYLCHNYFPPPPQDFVLNIASLDQKISEMSVQHILNALQLSKKLGGLKFGFHAGFLINIPVTENGKSIEKRPLFDRDKALEKFCANYKLISQHTQGIELYIENNVLSDGNYKNYQQANPFFLTDSEGLAELRKQIPLNLLLDVAHLKVSCRSLGLELEPELNMLIKQSDYIHISDNDGKTDSNGELTKESELFNLLKEHNLNGKTITLEVYSGIEKVKESYQSINSLIHGDGAVDL